MTDAAPDPAALERLAVDLALGAAQVVRDGRAAGPSVTTKSTGTDLVTDVDRATEQYLVERIAAERPGDAILGEESGTHLPRAGGSPVTWILDPIDGTVNFVLGIPQYAVSVAAEVDGTVVAAAVANPASGETFRARLGGGAYLDDQPIHGPRDVRLSRAVIATGFAYDAGRRYDQSDVAAQVLKEVGDLRRLGAASLDLCFLAAGRVDGYYEAGLNRWDFAAGGLVATEAGCVLTGLGDRPADERFLAAAGPGLAREFFAVLEDAGADLSD